jgi:hypothetical protein
MAVLTALATDTPSPPRELDPGVPPALDELVLRLLAKDPADRPASAQAVVEAIKAIERQLMAERQKSELSEATPRPVEADALKQLRVSIVEESSVPHPTARPRAGRRTRWIAAAVLGMVAAAAVAVGGFGFGRPQKRTQLIAADPVAPTPPLVEREGRRIATSIPEDQRQVQRATATVGSGRPAPAPDEPPARRPGPGDPPKADDPPAETRAMASAASPIATPGDDRRGRTISEKEGSTERPAKAALEPVAWSDIIDPDGDCQVFLDERRDLVTIGVPGTPHVLSAEIGCMNAPRVLRVVQGDFDAVVRVASVLHPTGRTTIKAYAPYHGAGILLWQDGESYVRLEIAADLHRGKTRAYANFELRKDGVLAVSRGLKIDDGSTYLRLRRRGDEIYAAFGPDGVHWALFPPLTAKLDDRLKIGVAAINTAMKPLKAELEGFRVSASGGPRANIDANRSVIGP